MRTPISIVLVLAALVFPYRSEARLPATFEQPKAPPNLNVADWTAIRAEYDRHRRGFFLGDGEYHTRSYSQQWLAKFDGRGFEVTPDHGPWTWGMELASYGFPGAERVIRSRALASYDVDHARYKWNSEIEEWFVNEPRGMEHGFTIAQRPLHPSGSLTLHLNVRGGLIARADGRSASFVDRDGVARITYSKLQATDARGCSLNARMLAEAGGLRIEVEEAGAAYPIRIDPIIQQAYLKASNVGHDDFGLSVAISGDTVVVGAPNESSKATEINGDQSDNSATSAGAAYVFVRSGNNWTQQAYLKASNTDGGDLFGYSVAISGDTVVVGAYPESSNGSGGQFDNSAPYTGAAYVFVRSGTNWTQQAYLKASNADPFDWFGFSVAISGDTVVVGAFAEDSNGSGGQSDNSAADAGAAYVFVRSGTIWTQQAYLKASNPDIGDLFGNSVAISGDTLVVGAQAEDSNGSGGQSNNSAFNTGAAYVFARNGTNWTQQAYLKGSDGGGVFGYSLAISGNSLVVGALNERAYVFVQSGTNWTQQGYLWASNSDAFDIFGGSVAISGDTVLVGARQESSNGSRGQFDNSVAGAGAAYVFTRSGANWTQQAYLKASNPDVDDSFGYSVAISGSTMVMGAVSEASNGSEGQSDNSTFFAGAAYVFQDGATFEFVTSVSPAAPLRSASGWIGMHIAVDDAPLKIKALGRYCVAGNNQVHTVKLVSANTKNDVPNATAAVNMTGCVIGQFVYADLSIPVTLTAKAHYYLVSQEVNGGDKWLDLGPVTTNPGAFVVGSIYYNNVLWITAGAASTSYVPTSMKYEIQSTPSSSAFVLNYNLDNRAQRNNFSGFVGLQVRVGPAPLTVNSVGRACIPGNSQTHLVKFVNATTGTDVQGGSAAVDMAGCSTDFVYQTLGSPIVLQANAAYYVVSSETSGGDQWTDQSQLTTSSDAAVLTSVYSLGTGYATNEAQAAYVPPNFLYTK